MQVNEKNTSEVDERKIKDIMQHQQEADKQVEKFKEERKVDYKKMIEPFTI